MSASPIRAAAPCLVPLAVVAAVLAGVTVPAAFAAGQQRYFTAAQAQSGHQVYDQRCAACHGAQLQGKAGPALEGQRFASNLQYSKLSAPQLFHFITTKMPNDDPGGLTQTQYLQVFAYILSQNGFQPGDKPLDKNSVGDVKLMPLPDAAGKGAGAG